MGRAPGISIAMLALLLGGGAPAAGAQQELRIVGWVERAQITPDGFQVGAKLDTGADDSSIRGTGCSSCGASAFFPRTEPCFRPYAV
ncbi:MAG: hypothetical protein GWO02_13620 [Gammaproteobacteria bacterium]|nr:hypothetical protein [Gammaproteobacteria bacterium]